MTRYTASQTTQQTELEAAFMFAIFEDGSHQYRVKTGDRLEVDFREAANSRDSLQFDRVLAAGADAPADDQTGSSPTSIPTGPIRRPLLDGASIPSQLG